jgi:hypothetical protein
MLLWLGTVIDQEPRYGQMGPSLSQNSSPVFGATRVEVPETLHTAA